MQSLSRGGGNKTYLLLAGSSVGKEDVDGREEIRQRLDLANC